MKPKPGELKTTGSFQCSLLNWLFNSVLNFFFFKVAYLLSIKEARTEKSGVKQSLG